MKKHNIRILMAALAVLAASCQKEGVRTLTATFEQFDNGSKAYIDDEYYACWEHNDAVAINGTTCAVTLTTGGGHANSAEITIPGTLSGEDLLAFYPAGKITDMSAAGGTVDFPHIQTYRVNADGKQIIDNPMAAYCPSDGEELRFRNLGALLKVTIPNDGDIKAIQVKGIDSQMLCGKAQLKLDINGEPMLSSCTGGSSSVTLRFPEAVRANGKSFYIVLPPNADFETLTIAVLSNSGTAWATHAKTADMGRVVSRNHIAAISYDLSHHEDYDFVADWTIRYTATERLVSHYDDSDWGTFGAEEAAYNFGGSKGLIVFNDIITRIGQQRYSYNSSLKVLNLPESVKEIGVLAFQNNGNLTSVSMPGVTTIDNSAFTTCGRLVTAVMPNATTIGSQAFLDCESLSEISLPVVTAIGDFAFSGCASLTMVSLPNVATVGGYAFSGCGLSLVSMPAAATIGDFAFKSCASLTTVSLGNATTIGNFAFSGCSSLVTISLPSATTIGNFAFGSCSDLTTVSIPNAITIGICAFRECSNLITFPLPNATTIEAEAFRSCPKLTTFSLPKATTIGEYAFNDCSSLASVTLPVATTIGKMAFSKTPLTTISLPCATAIGEYAFSDCARLTTFSIPNATTIGQYAFSGCSSLTSASLPEATTIGQGAFNGCSRLTSVSLPEVITIGPWAFQKAPLTTVLLPKATTIGREAFKECSSLTEVSLPNATTIEYGAFWSTPLTIVSLPSATTIGENAFRECKSLTAVTIPHVTSIEFRAFYDCTNLSLVYSKTAAPTMGSGVFSYVPGTAVLHLPSSLSGTTWSGWPGTYAYDYGN